MSLIMPRNMVDGCFIVAPSRWVRSTPGSTSTYFFFDVDFFRGTLAPSLRASESLMAIACFLLVTFFPEPLFNVPFFRSCIAFSTFLEAFLPYFAIFNLPSFLQKFEHWQVTAK